MRGRKPKPTALKLLAGNPGKRALNTHEPDSGPMPISPPDFLGEDGRECWGRLRKQIAEGVLRASDYNAAARYCRLWERWVRAERQIEDNPRDMVATGQALKLAAQLLKIEAEFGLTPSSRSRVKADPVEDPKTDGKSRFFSSAG